MIVAPVRSVPRSHNPNCFDVRHVEFGGQSLSGGSRHWPTDETPPQGRRFDVGLTTRQERVGHQGRPQG